jgi:hypothetical protein
VLKKNPLKNLGALVKLNPQAASARRNAILLTVRATALVQPCCMVYVSLQARWFPALQLQPWRLHVMAGVALCHITHMNNTHHHHFNV